MHPLSLVVFLTLAAGSDRPVPAGCREDYGTCREDCTIDYGGSTTKYRQLTQCLMRCDKERKECTEQHYSLQDAQLDSVPARQPEPYENPDKASTRPASSTQSSGDSVRRGVYRASEDESSEPILPAEKKEPVAAPAPAPKEEPKPAAAAKATPPEPTSSGNEEAPIEPAPKPVEPVHAKPPRESKKKDISDWDPNGD